MYFASFYSQKRAQEPHRGFLYTRTVLEKKKKNQALVQRDCFVFFFLSHLASVCDCFVFSVTSVCNFSVMEIALITASGPQP